MLIVDGVIILISMLVFGITKGMYGIVSLYIISLIADKVILGISDSKAFYVITEKEKEVEDFILNVLKYGVTIFDAKGGYSNSRQKVMFCVIPTSKYFVFKEGIQEIDSKAFFLATDAYEVSRVENNEIGEN